MQCLSFFSTLIVFFVVALSCTEGSSDPRQRFEGLVGKTIQAAWIKINREAPGRTMEVMRESAPQSNKPMTPGAVRVIVGDRTGRVLYTPILQPDKTN